MKKILAIYATHPSVVTIQNGVATDAAGNEVVIDNAAVEAFMAAEAYKNDRAAAYPSLADQLDMLYHDAVDGTTTWQEAVAAVKAAHPKPEA